MQVISKSSTNGVLSSGKIAWLVQGERSSWMCADNKRHNREELKNSLSTCDWINILHVYHKVLNKIFCLKILWKTNLETFIVLLVMQKSKSIFLNLWKAKYQKATRNPTIMVLYIPVSYHASVEFEVGFSHQQQEDFSTYFKNQQVHRVLWKDN